MLSFFLSKFRGNAEGSNQEAVLPASMHPLEPGPGVIPRGLSHSRFVVGLRVGHARIDALDNLFFCEPGIFQAADFRAAHGALALQSPVQNHVDGGIGKPDQFQHHRVGANDIELIRSRNFQNHGLSVARVDQIDGRIGAGKGMLVLVRVGNQSHAAVVRDAGLFQLYKLRHFVIGSVQLFELFSVAGPHPCLIERTIIRERMLIASARPEEEHQPEKHELVPHDSIVSGTDRWIGKCALRDTRPEGQVNKKCARNSKNSWRAKMMLQRRGKHDGDSAGSNGASDEVWNDSCQWPGW